MLQIILFVLYANNLVESMLMSDGRLVNHNPFLNSYNRMSEVPIYPPLHALRPGEECRPFVSYKDSCNVCRCSAVKQLHCTKMKCFDESQPYRKTIIKNASLPQRESLNDSLREKRDSDAPESCTPGTIIKQGCQRCFCIELGQTTKCNTDGCHNATRSNTAKRRILSPEDVRSPFTEAEFRELPSISHYSSECTPGLAYRLDCNTCLCKADGNLLCGQYLCLKHDFYYKKQAEALSGTSCSNVSNMTGRCVECSCQHDVMVCKHKPDCVEDVYNAPNGLRQGVASTNRNKPETAVDPYKEEKCHPGMIYRVHCNTCHCQKNGYALCTQKKCLNYVESQQLSKVIEELKERDRQRR